MSFIDWNIPWNSADILALCISLILFAVGIILGKRQSRIIYEFKGLQEALAELQIREKLGCIESNCFILEESDPTLESKKRIMEKSPLLSQDCLSVLPIYKFAPERLQIRYRNAINRSLNILNKTNQEQFSVLSKGVGEQVKKLETHGENDSAALLYGAIAQFPGKDS